MSSALHRDSRLSPSTESSNESGNESIHDLIARRTVSRRGFLASTAGPAAVAAAGGTVFDALGNVAEAVPAYGTSPSPVGGIGFAAVPVNRFLTAADDAVRVPAPPGWSSPPVSGLANSPARSSGTRCTAVGMGQHPSPASTRNGSKASWTRPSAPP